MPRPKGSPNKATVLAREAIARLVDGNAHRVQEWLDQVAESEGPLAALRCYGDLLEYHVPKLARTELVGDKDEPVAITVIHKHVKLADAEAQARKTE